MIASHATPEALSVYPVLHSHKALNSIKFLSETQPPAGIDVAIPSSSPKSSLRQPTKVLFARVISCAVGKIISSLVSVHEYIALRKLPPFESYLIVVASAGAHTAVNVIVSLFSVVARLISSPSS